MRPRLIVGNWKMNGTGAALAEVATLAAATVPPGTAMALCVPFTLIERAARAAAGSLLGIGAQDVHAAPGGAHTGNISVEMLVDAGAALVIVGHSERRADDGDTDAGVRAKATAALAGGLDAIICVGETGPERDRGDALAIVGAQLDGSLPDDPAAVIVAYEPVWAIGTGRVAAVADVAAMHAHVRGVLAARYGAAGQAVRILYGGSVNGGNAAALLAVADVDGALVGGASLTAAGLLAIARA